MDLTPSTSLGHLLDDKLAEPLGPASVNFWDRRRGEGPPGSAEKKRLCILAVVILGPDGVSMSLPCISHVSPPTELPQKPL